MSRNAERTLARLAAYLLVLEETRPDGRHHVLDARAIRIARRFGLVTMRAGRPIATPACWQIVNGDQQLQTQIAIDHREILRAAERDQASPAPQ